MQNSKFTEINPYALDMNVFDKIGREWMLLTARKPDGGFNQMTASWGGAGVMWNLPVCCCVIRPQRYTYEFTEAASHISMSFFGGEQREALKLCGSKSGRDCDKTAETGLKPVFDPGGAVFYEQATLALITRKLYVSDLREDGFIDRSLLENYKNSDFHRMYVCAIEKVLVRD